MRFKGKLNHSNKGQKKEREEEKNVFLKFDC
jgi:hypothetical protein